MTVRWGFLGAGFVASRAMGPAVHHANGAQLHAVASRDTERSRGLEPDVVHARYEDVLNDDRVDAVYISLANHQHLEWVTRSLQAGKHVLCEKPLGICASDVRAMYEVANTQGRHLIEATWVRWHPRFQRVVELATNGTIGNVQHIESAFTSMSDMEENYRLHPEMGGGALLDVGCYQAHVWAAVCGDDLDVTVRNVKRQLGPTGIDVTTHAEVNLNPYTTATCVSSFVMPSSQILEVRGSDSSVRMAQGEAFTSWRERSSLQLGDHEETFDEVDAFVVMVENVSAFLFDGSGWVFPWEHTVRVAEILDLVSAH